MSFDFGAILKGIAPGLATALLGPLGGLAVQAIGGAIGMDKPTTEKISDALTQGQLSGDQIVAIKQAEMDFQLKMQQMNIDVEKVNQDYERIASADRDSARKREVDVGDHAPLIIGAAIICTWSFIQWYLLHNSIPDDMREIIMRVLGTLDAALMMVLTYFFGTTAGSRAKDTTIATIAKS